MSERDRLPEPASRPVCPACRLVVPAALVLAAVGLGGGVTAQTPASPPPSSPTSAPQYPLFNQDDFVRTMKTVGQNFAAVNPAMAAGDFESAKSRAIRTREQLATTITFWRKNDKGDAVKLLRAATQRLDELDTALSKSPVDSTAASTAAQQVGAACQACHAAYREQDPLTKAYRIKL